jgi:hypothetical protein
MSNQTGFGTRHEQVEIEWRGIRAEVDVELAPLILEMWKAGVATVLSCQENRPGIAWIAFPAADFATGFLDLVAVHPGEDDAPAADDAPYGATLYRRIAGCGSIGDWQYALFPENYGVREKIVKGKLVETCTGPANFEFLVSVRFPRTDIPLILKRLQAVNAARAGKAVA